MTMKSNSYFRKKTKQRWIRGICLLAVLTGGICFPFARREPQTESADAEDRSVSVQQVSLRDPASASKKKPGFFSSVSQTHDWMEETYALPQICADCGQMQGWPAGSTISAGFYYTAAIREDGTVMSPNGMLNPSALEDAVMVSANSSGGGSYAIVLKKDATAEIALPGVDQSNSNYDYDQLDVSGWKNLVAVAAGDRHAVGLMADGTVVAVGSNSSGQCNVSQWRDIVAISAGEKHTVGLCSDGTVVAVGAGDSGQCMVKDWKNVAAVSAGANYTAGLLTDGTVIIAGNQRNLQTGSWDRIVQISAGAHHLVGLQEDGTVVSTGADGSNRRKVEKWENMVCVSAGFLHTAGIRADGVVVVTGESPDHNGLYFRDNHIRMPWILAQAGENSLEIRNNSISAYGSHVIAIQRDGSVRSTNRDLDLSGFRGVAAVSMGKEYALGLRPDGTVVFAGTNRLGDRTIAGAAQWTDIVALEAGYSHALGLKSDGTVVAVGNNGYGQCDVSDWEHIVSIDVSWDYPMSFGVTEAGTVMAVGRTSTDTYKDWTEIVDLEHGRMHTVGVRADGTVACIYGYGLQNVTQWTDIVAVSTSYDTVVGLRRDGTVVAAGENGAGQCNVSGWRNIAVIACGYDFTIGVRTDGTIVHAGRWNRDLEQVVKNIR